MTMHHQGVTPTRRTKSSGRPSIVRLAAVLLSGCAAATGVCGSTAHAADTRAEAVIERVNQRMVKIFGAGGVKGLYAYSTGFLVSAEGHIATVWSHVLDDQGVSVFLHDGRKFEGKIVGAEPQLDLAILKIDADDLPYFDIEDPPAAFAGTKVYAFSNMFKVATGDEPVSVLHGVIAARSRLTARRGNYSVPYTGPIYVVDAISNNPGAGGGVLTTRDGTLLGMIGKELRNTQTNTWMNYAIPITELKTAVGEIISGRFTSRRSSSEDDPASERPKRNVALSLGLVMVPDVVFRTPAYVDNVVPGSAAAKAGIRTNDLVLFVNDELVQSCRALRESLAPLESGDTVRVVVRRGTSLIPVELPVSFVEEREPADREPADRETGGDKPGEGGK